MGAIKAKVEWHWLIRWQLFMCGDSDHCARLWFPKSPHNNLGLLSCFIGSCCHRWVSNSMTSWPLAPLTKVSPFWNWNCSPHLEVNMLCPGHTKAFESPWFPRRLSPQSPTLPTPATLDLGLPVPSIKALNSSFHVLNPAQNLIHVPQLSRSHIQNRYKYPCGPHP